MNHLVRHLVQMASATLLLIFAGTTAALAGPAPIQEDFERPYAPPVTTDPVPSAGTDFPWVLTSMSIVLAVAAVAAIAVLWHRTHTGHHGLVTP